MLLATLADRGYKGVDLGIAPDKPELLMDILSKGLSHDVLITSGGVSMGEFYNNHA